MMKTPLPVPEPVLLDVVDSTNTYAREHFDQLPDGTMVAARCQTAGRGRRGRAWISPAGRNIYATFLFKHLADGFHSGCLVGVGALACLREAAPGTDAFLKWPNDLLVNGRKLAGILCEMSPARAPDLPAVVVGIGINVNNAAEQLPENPIFPATSLAVEAGHPFDRQALVDAFLDALQDAVTRLEAPDGIAETVCQFNEMDALLGKRVAIALPDGSTVTGEEAGAAEDGTLRIQTASGIESVIAGSLSLT